MLRPIPWWVPPAFMLAVAIAAAALVDAARAGNVPLLIGGAGAILFSGTMACAAVAARREQRSRR